MVINHSYYRSPHTNYKDMSYPNTASSSSFLSDLPAHVKFEIFARLPVNKIGHCRCVCKEWYNLLSEPHFIHLHISKSPSYFLINEYQRQGSTTFKLFEIDENPSHQFIHHEPSKSWLQRVASKLYLQGSINGLLCLWQFDENDNTYIFNPVFKEYVVLPKHKNIRTFQDFVSYGFGLSPITKQYKVVRIFQGKISECEVYTLGKNTWRSVGNVPFSVGLNPGVFMNGGLHWIKTEKPQMIARFDLETESFQMLCKIPPLYTDALFLNSLEDRLCICDGSSSEIVVWVMREYGVVESWSKEITIYKKYIPDWVGDVAVTPVKVLKDGSILMLWRDDRLFRYCSRSNFFEELDIGMSGYETNYEITNHVPSLLSLKNVVLEDVKLF